MLNSFVKFGAILGVLVAVYFYNKQMTQNTSFVPSNQCKRTIVYYFQHFNRGICCSFTLAALQTCMQQMLRKPPTYKNNGKLYSLGTTPINFKKAM